MQALPQAQSQLVRRGVHGEDKWDRFDPPFHQVDIWMSPWAFQEPLDFLVLEGENANVVSVFVTANAITFARKVHHERISVTFSCNVGMEEVRGMTQVDMLQLLDTMLQDPFDVRVTTSFAHLHPQNLAIQFELGQDLTPDPVWLSLLVDMKSASIRYDRITNFDLFSIIVLLCDPVLVHAPSQVHLRFSYENVENEKKLVLRDDGKCYVAAINNSYELEIESIRYGASNLDLCESGTTYLTVSLAVAQLLKTRVLSLHDSSSIRDSSMLQFGASWYGRWGFQYDDDITDGLLKTYRFKTWSDEFLKGLAIAIVERRKILRRKIDSKTSDEDDDLVRAIQLARYDDYVTTTFASMGSAWWKTREDLASALLTSVFKIPLWDMAVTCRRDTFIIPEEFQLSLSLQQQWEQVIAVRKQRRERLEKEHMRAQIDRLLAKLQSVGSRIPKPSLRRKIQQQLQQSSSTAVLSRRRPRHNKVAAASNDSQV